MNRTTLAALSAVATILVACGTADAAGDAASDPDPSTTDSSGTADEPAGDDVAGPATGMCIEGTTDCVDTVVVPADPTSPDGGDAMDEGILIREAESMLGRTEADALELFGETRLGRRGAETFALTEDYVIGRRTIATEPDASGTYVVVAVTLELTDGPLVIEAS